MNTAAFLQKAAQLRPDGLALKLAGDEVTYAEFHARALQIGGNLLAQGLDEGDRVAFVLPNSPRILEVIYGCFAAGLVVVPINARLHPREVGFIATNSGSKVLIHSAEYQDGIEGASDAFTTIEKRYCTDGEFNGVAPFAELYSADEALIRHVDAAPDDPAWLFYTSGTTGRPKGATWSHRVIRVMLMNYLADVYSIQPGETVLHCAPLSHGSGIVALPAVARAAANVCVDSASFSPDVLLQTVQEMQAEKIAFMAPTQIIKTLEDVPEAKYDISSLKSVCYGGAPIHPGHLKEAVRRFGPVWTQIFGQGEAPITITYLHSDEVATMVETDDPRLASAGRIRTDVECHCVDEDDNPVGPGEEGEVVVRGDVVMLGYWDNPEATAETVRDGWLHTGDIGKIDEHGYLFLLDRAKDMVISGGNNVYPREVEEVLIQHEAVNNVVVFGIPDSYWGEAVHAVVVLEEGADATDKDLIAFCGEHMAGYKKPKAVDFAGELPISAYGKILRREVREKYWEGHEGALGGGAPSRP